MKKPPIPTYIGEPTMKSSNFSFLTIIIIVVVVFAVLYFYDEYKKNKL